MKIIKRLNTLLNTLFLVDNKDDEPIREITLIINKPKDTIGYMQLKDIKNDKTN